MSNIDTLSIHNRKRRSNTHSDNDSASDNHTDDDDDKQRKHDKISKHESKRNRRSNEGKKKSKDNKFRSSKKSKRKWKNKYHSPTNSDSDSESSDSSNTSSSRSTSSSRRKNNETSRKKKSVVLNTRLLAKLAARGETLEERNARRLQRRAARIQASLGYTADDNPFNDPNLHETFTWKKREEKYKKSNRKDSGEQSYKKPEHTTNTLEEIEKVRKRRKERELQHEEMERIRAEESRMKELENYDEWARKEEEFHLQQQRQRSAIRLVEGREKAIDVLAKNILMFGLSDVEKSNRAAVKYQEKYSILDAVENLEAELEEPYVLLRMLKLSELEELLQEIIVFQKLERESLNQHRNENGIVQRYWDNLRIVAEDEIKFLKDGGVHGKHAIMVDDVKKVFEGHKSLSDLQRMDEEVSERLCHHTNDPTSSGADFDRDYWLFVKQQLRVHFAKTELSDLHSKMLVRQLEKLERRKEELAAGSTNDGDITRDSRETATRNANEFGRVSDGVTDINNDELGDLEEELGLTTEHDLNAGERVQHYSWQDKYRPRKPRYFNRVKSGYDWNKYNQTHYDKDNPPPRTVQGYKFNIFYPDLIDPTKTPQFRLEPANSDDFCIIRFTAGPPYEDIAFKIINREWNRSRKRGFKCTFERGVLSLYFNFTTHWYRK